MKGQPRNLPAKLEACLPPLALRALRGAIVLARRRRLDVYLAGGGVRDLLLDTPHADLDLVVEGDAIALLSGLAEALGVRFVAHPRFGTASLSGESFRVDLARARSETYARPGALPSVAPAALRDDLARRDFTINAMALCLSGPDAGRLIDPFGGRDDLARRQVRVLHDESFRDDATRILRACRYAGRLGFRIERRTAALLKHDLSYLDTISSARLRHELELIADEPRAEAIVRQAARLGVLAAVHRALRPGPRELRATGRLPDLPAALRAPVLCCLLLAQASPKAAEGAVARLALTGRETEAVRGYFALRRQARRLARASLRPSEAVRLLEPFPLSAVEAFALLAAERLAADRARRYLDEWRHVRPKLNGRDIEALGVARGPRVGALLALLRDARLDGRVVSRRDEIGLVEAADG